MDDRKTTGPRRRVLLLAESCNPRWPSLPLCAYRYALALGERADVTIATHFRNRPAIEADAPGDTRFAYIDTEWIARPLNRLAGWLRGDLNLAWSTGTILGYLPYLAFEHAVWRRFGARIVRGEFDLVHRISPMSPTLPSPVAGRGGVPFVLGPVNGGLDWPLAYRAEQRRERERLRLLRRAYRAMPYARRSARRAAAILAGFSHTIDDLGTRVRGRVVNFPEVGYDPAIFHAEGRSAPFADVEATPPRFLFAGRLVPYKLPEAAIQALGIAPTLARAHLHIAGDGPERKRLEGLAQTLGLQDRIRFEGALPQTALADLMRRCDALVFPSIRELGAGVVVEAMASGLPCIVADYGAPGALCAQGRGAAIPLAPLDRMAEGLSHAMADWIEAPETACEVAEAGRAWVAARYPWERKAAQTLAIYEDVLAGRPLPGISPYD